MIGVDKAVISRLHVSGQIFEILVDPDKALQFKKGMKIGMSEILAFPGIYHDVRNTKRVPEGDLQKFFGTADIDKIAEKIIHDGQLQLTTEQRREMVEQRRNQIANIISRKGINPQTNAPNPPQRIFTAMEKAGINIDAFVDAELQVDKVLKEIKSLVPIKFEKITYQFKIPSQFSGKAYSTLKSSGTIISEQWLNDESLQISLEAIAGMQDEIFQKLSGLTHGQFESKVLKKVDI